MEQSAKDGLMHRHFGPGTDEIRLFETASIRGTNRPWKMRHGFHVGNEPESLN